MGYRYGAIVKVIVNGLGLSFLHLISKRLPATRLSAVRCAAASETMGLLRSSPTGFDVNQLVHRLSTLLLFQTLR